VKKLLFAVVLSAIFVGCSQQGASVEEQTPVGTDTDEVSSTVTLNSFTFILPRDWSLSSQTETTAEISIPNHEDHELSLSMSLTEAGEGSLPSSGSEVTTVDGVQIYNIGCGGPFDCGNLAYNGVAYAYTFDLNSTEEAPENLDGIWVPQSSVTHEEIDAFIASVTRDVEDIGYGYNGEGKGNENMKLGYGSNDRIPAPEGWEILNEGNFTVYAPSGWVLSPEQGIDTYVGTISGDGMTLRYDYGSFVGLFSQNSEYKEAEYKLVSAKINGWEALIYTPKTAGMGSTVLNIESPKGEGNFNLFGENLSLEQEELAGQIFRTVYFGQ